MPGFATPRCSRVWRTIPDAQLRATLLTSALLGGSAPARVVVRPATAIAMTVAATSESRWPASSRRRPAPIQAERNPPPNASPAPTVSTTLVGGIGSLSMAVAVTIRTGRPPSVSRTACGPSSSNPRAARTGEDARSQIGEIFDARLDDVSSGENPVDPRPVRRLVDDRTWTAVQVEHHKNRLARGDRECFDRRRHRLDDQAERPDMKRDRLRRQVSRRIAEDEAGGSTALEGEFIRRHSVLIDPSGGNRCGIVRRDDQPHHDAVGDKARSKQHPLVVVR